MSPTVVFALVIAIESLAVITVIVGICFLIWGDFSVEADTQPRAKVLSAPQTTTTKKTTRRTPAARSAAMKTTASSAAAAPTSPPKVVMTKTARTNSAEPHDE
ncbi:hypothetical protein ACGFK1_04760 [Mycobacterium sp. NPDC048908]|uniref:hypothetical protein n=1 Tax=Mycobacterium sp. NPDC048908 TaxID=3364292 RepID=UPI00371AF6A1